MKGPLGVAVIGLGVGEQHARAYLRSGDCVLRWVYDLDPARMTRVIAELGEGMKAEKMEAILQDNSVDAVSIASYDDAHFLQVVAALQAGKHVFVEKPLCHSLEELRATRQAWLSSGGRHLRSNLVLCAAPMYQWLKGAIAGGELGDIYAFDGDYLYGRLPKITHGWRKDVLNYSVMLGGGVHLVDLMLWLTGERPTSVVAMGSRICTRDTEFRYDDYVATTFTFGSGLVGRITANFGCVHPHHHVVRVFGTKGTFIYDDQGPRLHTSRDAAGCPTVLNLSGLPSSKGDLIPGFVEDILTDKDPSRQIQHEFDVISCCVAVNDALAQNHPVEVVYI